MSDLVKRLREVAHTCDEYGVHSEIELEAADRIAELEAELKKENQSALIKQLREIGDFAASRGWGRDTIYFRAADRIAELEAAIYHYVNLVVSCEGVTFMDGLREPWVKLIEQVWDEMEKKGKTDEQ